MIDHETNEHDQLSWSHNIIIVIISTTINIKTITIILIVIIISITIMLLSPLLNQSIMVSRIRYKEFKRVQEVSLQFVLWKTLHHAPKNTNNFTKLARYEKRASLIIPWKPTRKERCQDCFGSGNDNYIAGPKGFWPFLVKCGNVEN